MRFEVHVDVASALAADTSHLSPHTSFTTPLNDLPSPLGDWFGKGEATYTFPRINVAYLKRTSTRDIRLYVPVFVRAVG